MWKGISLHVEIFNALDKGLKYGKVHSIFSKVINITDEDGNIISLMTKNMNESPFSILIDKEDFIRYKIVAGENVYFSKEKIIMNAKVIDISKATKYHLKRGNFNGNYSLIRANLEILRGILHATEVKEEYVFNQMALEMVHHRRMLFKKACLEEDIKEMMKTGRSLIGLGQGLTPSGDDVLMGAFLVLGLENSPTNHFNAILGRIIKGQQEETTDASYQGLLRASRGFYARNLVEAVEAMTKREDIKDILIDVLKIGHSSGRDLLYGMQIGYEILIEKENANVS